MITYVTKRSLLLPCYRCSKCWNSMIETKLLTGTVSVIVCCGYEYEGFQLKYQVSILRHFMWDLISENWDCSDIARFPVFSITSLTRLVQNVDTWYEARVITLLLRVSTPVVRIVTLGTRVIVAVGKHHIFNSLTRTVSFPRVILYCKASFIHLNSKCFSLLPRFQSKVLCSQNFLLHKPLPKMSRGSNSYWEM